MSIHLQSTSESINTKGIQLLVRFSIHMHIKKRAVAQTTHIRIHFLGSDPHGLDGMQIIPDLFSWRRLRDLIQEQKNRVVILNPGIYHESLRFE
jgi:hypothetical protein